MICLQDEGRFNNTAWLQARSGFTRTKLLKTLNDVTSLPNHIIEVLKVKSSARHILK